MYNEKILNINSHDHNEEISKYFQIYPSNLYTLIMGVLFLIQSVSFWIYRNRIGVTLVTHTKCYFDTPDSFRRLIVKS